MITDAGKGCTHHFALLNSFISNARSSILTTCCNPTTTRSFCGKTLFFVALFRSPTISLNYYNSLGKSVDQPIDIPDQFSHNFTHFIVVVCCQRSFTYLHTDRLSVCSLSAILSTYMQTYIYHLVFCEFIMSTKSVVGHKTLRCLC